MNLVSVDLDVVSRAGDPQIVVGLRRENAGHPGPVGIIFRRDVAVIFAVIIFGDDVCEPQILVA